MSSPVHGEPGQVAPHELLVRGGADDDDLAAVAGRERPPPEPVTQEIERPFDCARVGRRAAEPQHACVVRDLDAQPAGAGLARGGVAGPAVHEVAHERGDELVLGQALAIGLRDVERDHGRHLLDRLHVVRLGPAVRG